MDPTSPLIVPLGSDCYPRYCATKLGFKKRKRDGELTFPLDALGAPVAMVRYLAENDFEGMADPANLLVRRAPTGEPILCDRRFPCGSYNHEMPPATKMDFVADDFRLFTERYQRRIENLRSQLALHRRVVLFLVVGNILGADDYPVRTTDFEAIISSFEKRYPRTQFRLLVLIERFQQAIPDSWDGRIRVFNYQFVGPYTMYLTPLTLAITNGNILGSVVNSFGPPAAGETALLAPETAPSMCSPLSYPSPARDHAQAPEAAALSLSGSHPKDS